MLRNAGSTERLILWLVLVKLGVLPVTPYYVQMYRYASFTIGIRSITTKQLAAELPELSG